MSEESHKFTRGPEACNDCNVLVPFQSRCNKHPEDGGPCDHEDALQWQDVMWCKACGAIHPFQEAQDIPVGEWTLPEGVKQVAAPTDDMKRAAQLQHFLTLVCAAQYMESYATEGHPARKFLKGLFQQMRVDAEQLGLILDDRTDLLLLMAQTSDAIRELLE